MRTLLLVVASACITALLPPAEAEAQDVCVDQEEGLVPVSVSICDAANAAIQLVCDRTGACVNVVLAMGCELEDEFCYIQYRDAVPAETCDGRGDTCDFALTFLP